MAGTYPAVKFEKYAHRYLAPSLVLVQPALRLAIHPATAGTRRGVRGLEPGDRFIGWELNDGALSGCCLHIEREHLDTHDEVIEEKSIASYVAFKEQRDLERLAQNTTAWPIQKFNWRDLTCDRVRA